MTDDITLEALREAYAMCTKGDRIDGPKVIIRPEGTYVVSEYRTFVTFTPADGGPEERWKLPQTRTKP